jgi:hypothetical protein
MNFPSENPSRILQNPSYPLEPSCHFSLRSTTRQNVVKDLVNTPKKNFIRELHRNRLTHSESEADEDHFQLFILNICFIRFFVVLHLKGEFNFDN